MVMIFGDDEDDGYNCDDDYCDGDVRMMVMIGMMMVMVAMGPQQLDHGAITWQSWLMAASYGKMPEEESPQSHEDRGEGVL